MKIDDRLKQIKVDARKIRDLSGKLCKVSLSKDDYVFLVTRLDSMAQALKICASHALRETNGKHEYEGDAYGFIYKTAVKALDEE